jgi:hypothetical protein
VIPRKRFLLRVGGRDWHDVSRGLEAVNRLHRSIGEDRYAIHKLDGDRVRVGFAVRKSQRNTKETGRVIEDEYAP